MEPIVALESTVFTHGLPHPENVRVAFRLEEIIREERAQPRTIGILEGRIGVGLSEKEIRLLATSQSPSKVSRRDLPVVVARKLSGGTTVSATAWIARRAGIHVMATGGIGGVHRSLPGGSRPSHDVSADLEELGRTSIAVVCSGPKAILDLPATREYLETRGVTVVGFRTDELPAFYSRSSGLDVDVRCETPDEVASIIRARARLDLQGATLVVVPVPKEHEIAGSELEPIVDAALQEAARQGRAGGEVTPFLLDELDRATDGRTVKCNVALLENNAAVAARIVRSLAGIPIHV